MWACLSVRRCATYFIERLGSFSLHAFIGAIVLALSSLASTSAHATQKTITYYYTDPQGNVLATADAQGVVTSTSDYHPYGASSSTQKDGIGFGSHITEDDGLVYMKARYYDPSVGMFLSSDPLGIAEGDLFSFNRFNYSNSNPLGNGDPSGASCEPSQDSSGTTCSTTSPSPTPNPEDAAPLAGITVTATATSGASAGTAGVGARAIWVGGLAALGVSLYVVDSNSFNEMITGHHGCYGDASCQGPNFQLTKKQKVPIPGISGKQGSKDAPSWAKGERPFVGENGKEFADRLFKDKYGRGPNPSEKGSDGEWGKIKKFGDRSFKDP